MSNQLVIEPTEFTDARSGEKTYGYLIYDGDDSEYCNTWESIPDDDMEVLIKIINENLSDPVDLMLHHVYKNKLPIMIGNKYYGWKKIKRVFIEEDFV